MIPEYIALGPSAISPQRSAGIYKGTESKFVLADSYKALNYRLLEGSMICRLPTFSEQKHIKSIFHRDTDINNLESLLFSWPYNLGINCIAIKIQPS